MDSLVEAKEDSKSASVVFNNEKLNSIDANNNIEENKIEKSKFNLGNLVHLLTDIKPTGEKLKREAQEIYLEGADDDTSIQEILDEY